MPALRSASGLSSAVGFWISRLSLTLLTENTNRLRSTTRVGELIEIVGLGDPAVPARTASSFGEGLCPQSNTKCSNQLTYLL